MQTKQGAIKHRNTLLKKYGGEEGLKQHMSSLAKRTKQSWIDNGRKPRGFSTVSPDKLRKISQKGVSSRKKS